ncbi:RNA-binding S4 domain-containing protein [Oceanicella actignis]|uniref:RNA-binding S4 domain-containing protein n=1 Tax=Oceanicella actignis TaxID=1189325 RepID=UPI0011E65790|nr:RNA-binding S4 domain-containing protein [Oceanicella actignis]TYO89593.1 ribosome-associated heat shock protein Hsp15 [Oceanicella actignis]
MTRPPAAPDEDARAGLRVDKWLWHARIFRTRTLAARFVGQTGLRINGARIARPAALVRPGDVLTAALSERVLVLRVVALGARRGPAPEARLLYEDLSPPRPAREGPAGAPPARDPGAGRPTGRERRALDRLRGRGPLND